MLADLSKAETQALTNYGSGEDENEEEETEEFEAGPVDVQTSLQASADGQLEQEVGGGALRPPRYRTFSLFFLKSGSVSCFRGRRVMNPARRRQNKGVQTMTVRRSSFKTEPLLHPL